MSKTFGFLFGAVAEISYKMPSGGEFALDIFREDTTKSKEKFKDLRSAIEPSNTYASKWLPKEYSDKKVATFTTRVFEELIKETIENNRKLIVNRINSFDNLAKAVIKRMDEGKENADQIDNVIFNDLKKYPTNISAEQLLSFSSYLNSNELNGNGLFENRYFGVLLEYYKKLDKLDFSISDQQYLQDIIKTILQLQIGAMSSEVSRNLEDNVFEVDKLNFDFFDDLGGTLRVDFSTAGVQGLTLITKRKDISKSHPIIQFGFKVLDMIFSEVLNYKTLIDSYWYFLYTPKTDWAKFCKISIFLWNVRQYIVNQVEDKVDKTARGYYEELEGSSVNEEQMIIGTTNYSNLINEKLHSKNIIFLNGNINEFYDPYLNTIGSEEELNKVESHFIVPLLFTQSGTKPMTAISMSEKYVDYYRKLKAADAICTIGFGFNPDDEHINGIIRTLINKDNKELYVIKPDSGKDVKEESEELAVKLRVINPQKIHIIFINPKTRRDENGNLWINVLEKI